MTSKQIYRQVGSFEVSTFVLYLRTKCSWNPYDAIPSYFKRNQIFESFSAKVWYLTKSNVTFCPSLDWYLTLYEELRVICSKSCFQEVQLVERPLHSKKTSSKIDASSARCSMSIPSYISTKHPFCTTFTLSEWYFNVCWFWNRVPN